MRIGRHSAGTSGALVTGLALPTLLLVVSVSCNAGGTQETTAVDTEAIERELMQADRDFAEAVAERGLDGWVSYFAEDAASLELAVGGSLARGREAIRTQDARLFADPMVRLTWEPLTAGVFLGGDQGFTRGRFEVIKTDSPDGDRTVTSQGTYLTLWRRGPDGWKVILDTGVADEGADP